MPVLNHIKGRYEIFMLISGRHRVRQNGKDKTENYVSIFLLLTVWSTDQQQAEGWKEMQKLNGP